jgi:hypothetical protein
MFITGSVETFNGFAETILVGKLITDIIQRSFAKLIRDTKPAFIVAVEGKDRVILVSN